MTDQWAKNRCHVAQFIPWLRPDRTFGNENDPRNGMCSFVSRWPIRAGTKRCEHLMGGTLALDTGGFARLHICIRGGAGDMQSQGRLFLDENGFLMGVAAYGNQPIQWASWMGWVTRTAR